MMARLLEPQIVFSAVPDFYVEVERRENPGLRNQPVLVGGDPTKRGKVQSASREAQAAGISVGMPMREALELCPEAVTRPTDMRLYREVSGALVSCFRRTFARLEIGGLGEVYSEISGRRVESDRWAYRLLEVTEREINLPLQLGIAPSKWLARLAAEEAGRGSVKHLEPDAVAAFLDPLPIARLPRVGDKTARRLRELGASTVGELSRLGSEAVERSLGNHGLTILEMARGQDHSAIRATRYPKSISREETLATPVADGDQLEDCLRRLSASLESSLSREGLSANRVAIRVRLGDETRLTRSQTQDGAVGSRRVLDQAARTLLARCDLLPGVRVRSLTLVVAGLVAATGEGDGQLELFDG
ncbi:MAG: hypothetical protein VCC04_09010 [Myxococcota bacterium]